MLLYHNLTQISTDIVNFYIRKVVVHDKFPTYTCSIYLMRRCEGCMLAGDRYILSFQDSKATCFRV